MKLICNRDLVNYFNILHSKLNEKCSIYSYTFYMFPLSATSNVFEKYGFKSITISDSIKEFWLNSYLPLWVALWFFYDTTESNQVFFKFYKQKIYQESPVM